MRRLLLSCLLVFSVLGSTVVVAAEASAATTTFPSVTGGFGVTPKLKFATPTAPTTFGTKVLTTGHGAVLKKGNLLVANYLGQLWNGKVFDSSFSRNETFATGIGVGMVVKGWDQGLVGQKVGSRVLLVIPPAYGYGSTGQTSAGITAKSVIVFVVDIVAAYNKTAGVGENATVVKSSQGGLTVKNVDSQAPTVTVAKNTAKPTTTSTTLLSRGTGPKIVAGEIVIQFILADWTGKTVESTWKSGTPEGDNVGSKATPSPFDSLIGDPIGSRALVVLPAASGSGPYAAIVQVAAEVPASASKG